MERGNSNRETISNAGRPQYLCGKSHVPIEDTPMMRQYIQVANSVWQIVKQWSLFERDTIGKQLVRAADSIGANLVEGDGRYTTAEAVHFFVVGRASARETRYWMNLARDQELVAAQEGGQLIEGWS